jgi:hypothetical protein
MVSARGTAVPVIRVVLADDQELVRSGFAMILNAQPDIDVVAEAGGGAAALLAFPRPRFLVSEPRPQHLPTLSATSGEIRSAAQPFIEPYPVA